CCSYTTSSTFIF
nr:immunoglobulin light chain junction region [Macaca mulatta]MPO03003.1 immunoglobulin light chain junction region [Macaca mulatta]MPO03042.1 immunoglobulin light chain junction region [Macaca mulatta]MPO03067.1 immunoglobulin light chain junction region [Macaca mulatta]MPO03249.1 immunoglobulin light chain junction region [Macaca mulatta]